MFFFLTEIERYLSSYISCPEVYMPDISVSMNYPKSKASTFIFIFVQRYCFAVLLAIQVNDGAQRCSKDNIR